RTRPRLIRVEQAMLFERVRAEAGERCGGGALVTDRFRMARDPRCDDRGLCRAPPVRERRAMQGEALVLVRRRVHAFLDERLAKRMAAGRLDENFGSGELAQTDVDVDRRGRAT